jgi:hypothetical protein
MFLIGICLIRSAMKIGNFPDFGLGIIGFLRLGISVYVGRAADNTSHGEAAETASILVLPSSTMRF